MTVLQAVITLKLLSNQEKKLKKGTLSSSRQRIWLIVMRANQQKEQIQSCLSFTVFPKIKSEYLNISG